MGSNMGEPTPGSGQRGGPPQSAMPGEPAGARPGAAPPRQWAQQYPVNEEETRVTGRRLIQYIVDYVLAGIIPGLAYWLLARGGGFLHGLG
jgi:hypothetical protein